jgi:hypothetical protein
MSWTAIQKDNIRVMNVTITTKDNLSITAHRFELKGASMKKKKFEKIL